MTSGRHRPVATRPATDPGDYRQGLLMGWMNRIRHRLFGGMPIYDGTGQWPAHAGLGGLQSRCGGGAGLHAGQSARQEPRSGAAQCLGRGRRRGLRRQCHRDRHQAAEHGGRCRPARSHPAPVVGLVRECRCRGPDRFLRAAGAGLSGHARRRRSAGAAALAASGRWSCRWRLQIQVLEAEHLPVMLNEPRPTMAT